MPCYEARNIKKVFFVFEIQSWISWKVWLAQKIVLIQGDLTKHTGAPDVKNHKHRKSCNLFGLCSPVYVSSTVFKENIKHSCFKRLFQNSVKLNSVIFVWYRFYQVAIYALNNFFLWLIEWSICWIMDNASLISNVLPKLDSTMKQKLLNLLEEKGVETPEDWDYVTPEELSPPLKLIEARKLVKKGKLPQGSIFFHFFQFNKCSS